MILASCSRSKRVSTYRVPSSITSITENFLTIKKGQGVKTSYFTNSLNSLVIEYVKGDIAEDEVYKITDQFEIDESKIKLKVIRNFDIPISNEYINSLIYRLKIISSSSPKPPFFLEGMYNVRSNDYLSIYSMLEHEKDWIKQEGDSLLPAQIQEYTDQVNSLEAEVIDNYKIARKGIKSLKEQRKKLLTDLDGQKNQLKALVLENNREEVANLIESYLPREDFSPFENKFWDRMLEAIRRPVPMSERVFLFRGFDKKNLLHTANYNGVEVTVPFASILDKNQGSYNRRLRSLETMLSKEIATSSIVKGSGNTKSSRITALIDNHKNDPLGSPFVSYSSSFSASRTFSNGFVGAYGIDPRVLIPSITSHYSENEWIGPLVSFPDEFVAWVPTENSLALSGGAIREQAVVNIKKLHPGSTDLDIDKFLSNRPIERDVFSFKRKYLSIFNDFFKEASSSGEKQNCLNAFKAIVIRTQ